MQFSYLFYVDFEASMADENAQNALRQLQENATFLRVLGSYPADDSNSERDVRGERIEDEDDSRRRGRERQNVGRDPVRRVRGRSRTNYRVTGAPRHHRG